jgi:UDPglucose 6-dehydrogenase
MERMDIAKQICAARGPIAVLGLGHVGLPTALAFAELGWQVIAADSDASKVAMMREGRCPFFEPGLQELLSKQLGRENLRITEDVEGAVEQAAVLFLCVGTPQAANGEADLAAIETLARTIAQHLHSYKLIVEKSTVPAITAQLVKRTLMRGMVRKHSKANGNGNGQAYGGTVARSPEPGKDFDVASNPEFLQEGTALQDFFHPDRVVCGVESERARQILAALYKPLQCPVLFTDVTTAELIKHAANAFLATKISFINMVGDICEAVGADVKLVARGIGMDPRIGESFLHAGIGFGGYCLPKDLRAFIRLAEDHLVDAAQLRATENINLRRIDRIVKTVTRALWICQGKTIAVLGVAFKAGTDDTRESPALKVAQRLRDDGVHLQIYDPAGMLNAQQVLPAKTGVVTYCNNAYEAAKGAHAMVVLTEWNEFRELDLQRVRALMQVPIVVDGRNLWDPDTMKDQGFEYHCLGRPHRHSGFKPVTRRSRARQSSSTSRVSKGSLGPPDATVSTP